MTYVVPTSNFNLSKENIWRQECSVSFHMFGPRGTSWLLKTSCRVPHCNLRGLKWELA